MNRFRPLSGIKVFIGRSRVVRNLGRLVSVPSRGFRFLTEWENMDDVTDFQFPSPIGD